MERSPDIPTRFASLPTRQLFGRTFPVAFGLRARLLGLAFLDRDSVGPGLFIPGCRSVHTFGMRFSLDLVFLDRFGCCISLHRDVGPARVITEGEASSVLEVTEGIFIDGTPGCAHPGGRETVIGD